MFINQGHVTALSLVKEETFFVYTNISLEKSYKLLLSYPLPLETPPSSCSLHRTYEDTGWVTNKD